MAQTFVIALSVIVLVVTHGISAKRGCSAFGHSCFGGHGKRSSDNPVDINREGESYRRQMGQEETPPHPGYPRSAHVLPSGDDIIPIRDGGAFEHEDNSAVKEIMKFKLRDIVKHWMENYRRTQQSGDDGYFVETL